VSTGREHHDRRDITDELDEARGVRLALAYEPVERVSLAGDDGAEPHTRVLGARVVRRAVERPVLHGCDDAFAVLTGEGELDAVPPTR
jgi:hypothetical protein